MLWRLITSYNSEIPKSERNACSNQTSGIHRTLYAIIHDQEVIMHKKRKIEELTEVQKKILFGFAESLTDDLNYVTDSEHKSYHLHEKVRKYLCMEIDYFYLELRNLFRYGYLDLINEKFYFMSDIGSVPGFLGIDDRLEEISNTILINGPKDKSCISKYGLLAINFYLLEKNRETIDSIEEFKEEILGLKVEIAEHKGIINSFNSQILTIIAALVAIFSIIGLNLGTIKYLNELIVNNIMLYIGSILAINASLIYRKEGETL